MRADFPSLLPLICPVCRRVTEHGRELYTLSLQLISRESPPLDPSSGHAATELPEVEEGILQCDNPACGQRYPIVGGIPVVVPQAATVVQNQAAALLSELSPQLLMLLGEPGPDDSPLGQQLQHLSIYLDAHYGDRAMPPADGPGAGWGLAALTQLVAQRSKEPVARAIELGCSVGRLVGELAVGAQLTVGVDLNLAALLKARRVLRGQSVTYLRRGIGRHYQPVQLASAPARSEVALICGDALDPPLVPHEFERVLAVNLLDSVRVPLGLLSVMDGLCSPGGELILGSPYAWQSGIVDEEARLGGATPEHYLRQLLTQGTGLEARYALEADTEVSWHLRRDARSAQSYAVHVLRARKLAQ